MSDRVYLNLASNSHQTVTKRLKLLPRGERLAKITDKGLQARPDKDKWLSDEPLKGHGQLVARVTKAGRSYFYFRYSHDKRQIRYRFGSYDPKGEKGFTLKMARSKALEFRQLYLTGITDIKGHFERQARLTEAQQVAEEVQLEVSRREAESRKTVADYFKQWKDEELSKRKDGGKESSRMMTKDVIPAIGERYLEEIGKADIRQIVKSIQKRGADVLAREVFTLMRQMFQCAVDEELIENNPTASLNKKKLVGTGTERDRVLSEEEIKLLARQLEESGLLPTAQAAVWICLSTLCRIGELSKAKWKHVDFDKRVWTIPPENAKNGIAIEVSLSDFALRQFEVIQSINHDTPWLFSNRSKDGHICTKTITKQVGDRQRSTPMSNRSQKSDTLILPGGKWTPHDLRRTGATLMQKLGIKPEVIDRCQNHKEEKKIRRTYQRYSYAPEMKEAWELLGLRLEGLTNSVSAAKIIPLHSHRG